MGRGCVTPRRGRLLLVLTAVLEEGLSQAEAQQRRVRRGGGAWYLLRRGRRGRTQHYKHSLLLWPTRETEQKSIPSGCNTVYSSRATAAVKFIGQKSSLIE